jgi:hypothetical protein
VLTTSPVPGAEQIAVLEQIIPIFEAENQLSPGADAHKALEELFATQFIEQVVAAATPTP